MSFITLENIDFEIDQIKIGIKDIRKKFQPPKRTINQYIKQTERLLKELTKTIDSSFKIRKVTTLQPLEVAHNELNNFNTNLRSIMDNLIALKKLEVALPMDYQSKATIKTYSEKLKEYQKKRLEEIALIKNQFLLIQSIDSEDKCPILFDNFKKGDKIFKTACNHKFNWGAFKDYIKTKSNPKCPVCKGNIIQNYKYINYLKKVII